MNPEIASKIPKKQPRKIDWGFINWRRYEWKMRRFWEKVIVVLYLLWALAWFSIPFLLALSLVKYIAGK